MAFDQFNAAGGPATEVYLKMSEMPVFVPMKIRAASEFNTVNGPTGKFNAVLGTTPIFFFLNKTDHGKMLEFNMYSTIQNQISANLPPFCFVVKRRFGVGIGILQYDASLMEKCVDKKILNLSEIPLSIQAEIDIAGLAASGIVFEP